MSKRVIVGTAGHIDHGKSALVRALPGIDPDRLQEGKERGVTIELGVDPPPAPPLLPSGTLAGIIDAPGHEKFVRTMVAGAAGIDIVMLVIAADEGVMPQTREHLDICRLLSVGDGLVALTKCDKVDADWAALQEEEVRKFVRGTFLSDAPVVRVSAVTGKGLPALVGALDTIASRVRGKDPELFFRLPVDRSFSMKGFGTVITGTITGGTGGNFFGGNAHRGEPSRGGKGERAARVGPVPPGDVCPHEGGRCASRIPAFGCEAAEEPGARLVPRGDILFPREDPSLRRRGDFSRRIGVRADRTRRGDRPHGGGPVHPARLLPPRKFRLHHRGRTDPFPLSPPPQGAGKGGPAGVALVTVSRGGGPGPGSPGRGRAEWARDERGRRHRGGRSCRGRRGNRAPRLIGEGSAGDGGRPGLGRQCGGRDGGGGGPCVVCAPRPLPGPGGGPSRGGRRPVSRRDRPGVHRLGACRPPGGGEGGGLLLLAGEASPG